VVESAAAAGGGDVLFLKNVVDKSLTDNYI
jgi:hypothetical protein